MKKQLIFGIAALILFGVSAIMFVTEQSFVVNWKVIIIIATIVAIIGCFIELLTNTSNEQPVEQPTPTRQTETIVSKEKQIFWGVIIGLIILLLVLFFNCFCVKSKCTTCTEPVKTDTVKIDTVKVLDTSRSPKPKKSFSKTKQSSTTTKEVSVTTTVISTSNSTNTISNNNSNGTSNEKSDTRDNFSKLLN